LLFCTMVHTVHIIYKQHAFQSWLCSIFTICTSHVRITTLHMALSTACPSYIGDTPSLILPVLFVFILPAFLDIPFTSLLLMLSVADYVCLFICRILLFPVKSFGFLLFFILLSIAMRKRRNLMHMHRNVYLYCLDETGGLWLMTS